MGESGGVEQYLFDGISAFAMIGELGDVAGDRRVDIHQALAHQGPDRRRDKGLCGREDTEPRGQVGLTEALLDHDLSAEAQRHLHRRQQAIVDLAAGTFEQLVHGSLVKA